MSPILPLLGEFYKTNKDVFDFFKDCIVMTGVIIGVWKYWLAKKLEAAEAVYRTYDEVDNKYYEYQQLCLQYPELDIGPTPKDHSSQTQDPDIHRREIIALSLLFSLFERTYLMYKNHHSHLKRAQWEGWINIYKHIASDRIFAMPGKRLGIRTIHGFNPI